MGEGATPSVRTDGDSVRVLVAPMRRLLVEVYRRAGCNDGEASTIAERLIGANLRGHESHGVIRTPRYVEWIEDGIQVPNQTLTVEQETDVLAIVDGHFGFGQTIGEQTVDVGLAKVRKHGVALTALRNSGHLGRCGDWAERAAAANCASIHMVNVRGSLLVAPFGGVDRRGSTSPFACGVPVAGGTPIILDFATALVAEGKALVALRGGKPLPDGALVSPDGTLSSDPALLYGEIETGRFPNPRNGPGALTGFGLHKGSGLNFFMEMFGGALTGSGTAGGLHDTEGRRFCNGMLSIYMDLDFFHSGDWFANEVRSYVEFVKSSRPTEAGGEVLVPGEVELRRKAEREVDGLPLSSVAWNDILGAARRVGMTEDAIETTIGH